MDKAQVWLRAETKPFEQRVALVPTDAAQLVRKGYSVVVEDSHQSIFSPKQYADVGCKIVAAGSWTDAPASTFVLGLKELPEKDFPLKARHIFFGHAFKEQRGWEQLLRRFKNGQGELLDLEYLVDDQGRRVAAFGYWAGFAGAAVAMLHWLKQTGPLQSYHNKNVLISQIRAGLGIGNTKELRAIVLGAKGRCGSGACDFFQAIDVPCEKWDIEETKGGGPFRKILDFPIFVNCVLTQTKMPPFLTRELIREHSNRTLRVIADVSCDPSSPFNSLPIYDQITSFTKPSVRVANDPSMDLIAIDHLPSLLPRESSEDFSGQLLPHLLQLATGSPVWERARDVFMSKSSGV